MYQAFLSQSTTSKTLPDPRKALSELVEGRPVFDSFDPEISEISILSKLLEESSRLLGLLDSLSRTESGRLAKRGSSSKSCQSNKSRVRVSRAGNIGKLTGSVGRWRIPIVTNFVNRNLCQLVPLITSVPDLQPPQRAAKTMRTLWFQVSDVLCGVLSTCRRARA